MAKMQQLLQKNISNMLEGVDFLLLRRHDIDVTQVLRLNFQNIERTASVPGCPQAHVKGLVTGLW
jgi:hypothetical protein